MKSLRNNDILTILALFAIWRIYLLIVAATAVRFIPEFGASFPYYNERLIASGLPNYIWSFGNFDGVHYLGIAKDGYVYQFTQAFFPLYPIFVRLIDSVFSVGLLQSALLLSNLAFFLALVMFYKLITLFFEKKTAFMSVVFLLAFPTSYYFGAAYTESLFLLFVITSFYFFHKQRIVIASIFGILSSLSRLVGIFISLSLQQRKKIYLYPLLLTPIGILLYMTYLKLQFDNAFYFITSQNAFGQERTTTELVLLPQVIYRWVKQILTTDGIILFNAIFEISTLIFAVVTLIISWKKLPRQWVVFSTLSILTPTLTGSLASMPRYVLIAFPMFIVLAQIKSSYLKIIILLICVMLLTIATALFTRGYWIA